MTSQQSKQGIWAFERWLNRITAAFAHVVHVGDHAVLRAGAQVREAIGHPLKPFPFAHVTACEAGTSPSLPISAQETRLMREHQHPLGIAGLPSATLQQTHAFLTLLPTWVPMPETRRHGHGQVALEWSGQGARKLCVLIGQDGMLIYSARLGAQGRLDGAEPISDKLSPIMSHVIGQLQD